MSHRINVWYMLPINSPWKSTIWRYGKWIYHPMVNRTFSSTCDMCEFSIRYVDAVCRKIIEFEFCRVDSWIKSEADEQVRRKSHPVSSTGWNLEHIWRMHTSWSAIWWCDSQLPITIVLLHLLTIHCISSPSKWYIFFKREYVNKCYTNVHSTNFPMFSKAIHTHTHPSTAPKQFSKAKASHPPATFAAKTLYLGAVWQNLSPLLNHQIWKGGLRAPGTTQDLPRYKWYSSQPLKNLIASIHPSIHWFEKILKLNGHRFTIIDYRH